MVEHGWVGWWGEVGGGMGWDWGNFWLHFKYFLRQNPTQVEI